MSTTSPALGHSPDWARAYRAAAPEDTAQRDLVRQLALPIRADQTHEQAQRVAALRAQITLMRPVVAERLHTRLTGRADPLGLLFRLTLHRVTIASLLKQLDAKRRSTDRGTTIANPIVDRRVPPHQQPKTPQPPDQRTSPRPPDPVPPVRKPVRPPVPPQDPWKTYDPWPGPVPPPWMGSDEPDNTTDWPRSALTAAASSLGMVLSVGMRAVSTSGMKKALEAAWLVFQITEAEPAALIGMAGEAAAEAFLAEVLGLDPTTLVNLNTVMPNFPVIDLIGPSLVASVKTRGVLSTLPAAALTKQLRSQYTSDLLDIITGDKKLAKAAQALLDHRAALGRAWPRDLRATTVEGVSRYLREKTVLPVPRDHVSPLRGTLGEDLYRRLKGNKRALDLLGITSETELSAYINKQADRIVSMGPRSTDFRVLAETAANHLPADVNAAFRKKHAAIIARAKGRAAP